MWDDIIRWVRLQCGVCETSISCVRIQSGMCETIILLPGGLDYSV